MTLPPPQPLPPPSPQPARKMSSNWGIAIGVAAAIAFLALRAWAPSEEPPSPSRSRATFSTAGGVCTIDGYSLRVTNTGDDTITGKLWATASLGGKIVGRDDENVIRLAPGVTVTVEFVWVLDAVSTCRIESSEWRD